MQRRDRPIQFYMNEAEVKKMRRKMEEMGIRNLSAYLRKMALDGYCIHLDLSGIQELVSLLRYSSNNLNQYAKAANTNGSIYAKDIADLQKKQDEIWLGVKKILGQLAELK